MIYYDHYNSYHTPTVGKELILNRQSDKITALIADYPEMMNCKARATVLPIKNQL